MTDFETAVQRLTAWLRDYGPTKSWPFVDDITLVLTVAKEAARYSEENVQLQAKLATVMSTLSQFVDKELVWCSRCRVQLTIREQGLCLSCGDIDAEEGEGREP